jgi:hypothetical protein
MDDDYNRAQQENLTNPKNRFLGLFCHAKEVDNSWGCNWSFPTGVIMFSIIIGIASLCDIYYIAEKDIFDDHGHKFLKFMVVIKIISDFISFIGIGFGCFAVSGMSGRTLTYSIVSYWVEVLSFLLNTIFLFYSFIAIFCYFDFIGPFIAAWCVLEFGLLVFCWILFCNQVYQGRKVRGQLNPQSTTGY